MRGKRSVRLVQLVRRKKGEGPEKSKADTRSWEGVDRGLFEALRGLRREVAAERQVAPFLVFSDATLRELARQRPSTPENMRPVYGVGEVKLRAFGTRFLALVVEHCRQHNLPLDVVKAGETPAPPEKAPRERSGVRRALAFDLFRRGRTVEAVMENMGVSRGTVVGYLAEFIREERPASLAPWVADAVYQRVVAAARQFGTERMKPIYLALGEQVSYDDIRLVLADLQARSGGADS
jgi:ATP-dependent DNA helicase RecQ